MVGALYTYFESAVIVMIIYLSMTLLASYLLRAWEKALDGPQNYDLNTTDTLAYTRSDTGNNSEAGANC